MDLGTGVVILCPPDDSDENCDGCTKMGRLGRFMQVLFMPDEHPEEDVHWDVAVVFIVEIRIDWGRAVYRSDWQVEAAEPQQRAPQVVALLWMRRQFPGTLVEGKCLARDESGGRRLEMSVDGPRKWGGDAGCRLTRS